MAHRVVFCYERLVENKAFHLQVLREELAKRKLKNPQFSLRAFAAKLGVDSGALSSVLSEKRMLSLKLGRQILERLDCSPETEKKFLLSIAHSQIKRPLQRRDPDVRLLTRMPMTAPATILDESIYQSIAEWQHAAILELSFRDDFRCDPLFVAGVLGISTGEAKVALDRLFDLGLLVNDGIAVRKRDAHLDGNNQRATNAALRHKQKQIREKAIEAIENQVPEKRYMTTVTMCIDPDLLNEARRRIDQFNDELCAFLESGKRREVYTLELGLFSLEIQNATLATSKGVPHESKNSFPQPAAL